MCVCVCVCGQQMSGENCRRDATATFLIRGATREIGVIRLSVEPGCGLVLLPSTAVRTSDYTLTDNIHQQNSSLVWIRNLRSDGQVRPNPNHTSKVLFQSRSYSHCWIYNTFRNIHNLHESTESYFGVEFTTERLCPLLPILFLDFLPLSCAMASNASSPTMARGMSE